MKYFSLLLLILVLACNNFSSSGGNGASDTSAFITTDTVPGVRLTVSKKPVASYLVPVNDPKLGRTFGVDIFETKSTFQYLMRMHYEAIQETDTINIPNFGIWPEIKVVKGPEKISCIIGFLDKKKVFKEYKMVTAKGNNMRLILLKKYSTGRFRTRIND